MTNVTENSHNKKKGKSDTRGTIVTALLMTKEYVAACGAQAYS